MKSSKLRICLVSREYPPETGWGGIGTHVHILAHALSKQGHEIHVISQATCGPKEYSDGAIVIHRVGFDAKRYTLKARLDYTFYSWMKLLELNRHFGFDIVEAPVWGAEGLLFSIGKKSPLVVSMHTCSEDLIKNHTYRNATDFAVLKFLSVLERYSAKVADFVIINSHWMLNMTKRWGIKAAKVGVVYHGIDTDKFKPVASNPRGKLTTDNRILILYVGRLEYRKGVHILYEATKNLIRKGIPVRVLLVGRDSMTAPGGESFKGYLLKRARTDKIDELYTFIEFVDEQTLISLYSACDIFVLPSLHESFGLVLLEAMACEKPVVSTHVGGIPEIINHGVTGLIVPSKNSGKLSEAIELLCRDKNLRITMGKKARKRVESLFSLTKLAENTVKIYEAVLSSRD